MESKPLAEASSGSRLFCGQKLLEEGGYAAEYEGCSDKD